MFSWIISNIGTILVVIALIAIVAVIIVILIKDKKKGKSLSCGGSCCHCPMAGKCHQGKK